MANYLQVSMQQTIITLKNEGWSNRRIARELGINRRTVRRYINLDASKCTISTAGSEFGNEEVTNSKYTISTTGSPGRKSLCGDYHHYIGKRIERGFSAQRIYQDLKQVLNTKKLRVSTIYNPRGGFDTTCTEGDL